MPPSPLACPVRGCGLALALAANAASCLRGHAFDRSRRGVLNLLQPQDRRSLEAGDARDIVAARARLADLELDRALVETLMNWCAELGPAPGAALLEVGCGVGTQLAALAAARPLAAFGLDLSAHAADAAARRHPRPTWLVGNADRRLPFLDRSLDVLLSVKGPKNPAEFARVLVPGGRLCVVVPGVDDLVELRSATAAGGLRRDPAARALERFQLGFTLASRREVRDERLLAGAALQDLLHVAYRGRRQSEAARAAELQELRVTLSSVVLELVRDGRADAAAHSGGSS